MINIEDIESLCSLHLRQLGGLKRIRITDFENFTGTEVAPGSDIYTINFRPFTASYDDDGKTSRSGDFHTAMVKTYVPRHRFLAEKLIMELADRRCIVYALDWNGDEHLLFGARFMSKFSTGAQLADSNGYEWKWELDYVKKPFISAKILADLDGDEGVIPGEDTGGGTSPGPGTPTPEAGCCITVNTTPIAYLPTPTGNIAHRNKFITSTIDGNVYVIDKNGASIKTGSGSKYQAFNGPAASVTPTGFNLADTTKLIVIKNGVVMQYNPAMADMYMYNIVGVTVVPFLGLESGDLLQIYQIG